MKRGDSFSIVGGAISFSIIIISIPIITTWVLMIPIPNPNFMLNK